MCTSAAFCPRGGSSSWGGTWKRPGQEHNDDPATVTESSFSCCSRRACNQLIAAKARAFGRLCTPEFNQLATRILSNARELAASLTSLGYEVCSGGTDNHIILFQTPSPITGLTAQEILERCGIIVNKNKTPGDSRPASITSGVRLGTNTVSLRGMEAPEMRTIAGLIERASTQPPFRATRSLAYR